jgi:putative transposase
MRVFSIAKGFYRLSKNAPPELSQKEFDRLRALTIYTETQDVKLVRQAFGISRATLYRWMKRFDPKDLISLREESRRPRRVRRPLWSRELMEAVKELREEYPRWGEDKLVVLVREQGYEVSNFHGGSYFEASEAEGRVEGAQEEEHLSEEEESEALWGEEA